MTDRSVRSAPPARSSWLIRAALLPAVAGFAVMGLTWTSMDSHRDGIAFAVASWVAALDLCIVGGVLHRAAASVVPGGAPRRCPHCAYDLSRTSGTCPECGSSEPPRARTRTDWTGLILVAVGVLVGVVAATLGSLFAWPAVWHV